MADPRAVKERRQLIARLSLAARAFAQGHDGRALVPSELGASVERWSRDLTVYGLTLDHERWLMGLVTLACLADCPSDPNGERGEPGLEPLARRESES